VELAFASATELAGLVRRGEVSPVELVEAQLRRIEALDPQLNAFVTVCAEQALASAREAETQPDRPFRGVPVTVKDTSETVGVRTTFSSRVYADHVPHREPAVVRRLRDAGFILLGKTNAPEFATLAVTESVLNGPCRNPWDTTRNAGGSSGGAAAAVAAGLCPVAHGGDGGGSLRIPASCCGVVGLKPARGRVSHAPYGGFADLPTYGPIARTVLDAAAVLDVMAGYEAGDPYWAPPPERAFAAEAAEEPRRLRVAVTTEPPIAVPVDPECADAVEQAAALLAELGHSVEQATPDWRLDALEDWFTTVWQVSPALFPVPEDQLAQVEPINRALIEAARRTSSVEYSRSMLALREAARRIVAFWDRYAVLVTPTLALAPVPVGWVDVEGEPWEEFRRGYRFTPFTPVANVTGQPAISLPLSWRDDGLPIGVQLIGPPAGEQVLVRLSAQLEAARPWAARRPPAS
jgi:amidase